MDRIVASRHPWASKEVAMPGKVIFPDGARVIEAMGNRLHLIVPSEATGGLFSVVDFHVAPSFRAPPLLHRHPDLDWWGHVLEGEILVELDSQEVRAPVGSTVFVPRGTSFRWWNPDARAARWLLTYSPGGFEQYFVDVAAALENGTPKTPAELQELVGPLWKKYRMEMGG
jgi:mannose-6-phosphate isomerase-like protein (cupin superfamily)